MREEVVHQAKSNRARAACAQHSLAIEALRPVENILLSGDPLWTAVGRQLFEARLRQLLQEERDLGEQGVYRLRGVQSPVRAADGIRLAGQTTSGRSRV
ncbi:MAG TPA: hypothetical protein VM051_06810 [Usitatibacter sp.]|nr:hypothetical protein [Usitatibacter sp.]